MCTILEYHRSGVPLVTQGGVKQKSVWGAPSVASPVISVEAPVRWWGFSRTLLILAVLLKRDSDTGFSNRDKELEALGFCLDTGIVPGVLCGEVGLGSPLPSVALISILTVMCSSAGCGSD